MAQSIKSKELNAAMTDFVKTQYAEKLMNDGFSCPDDKLLCWYRFTEAGIVQSLFFYSITIETPWHVYTANGIHPWYIKPHYFTRAYNVKRIYNYVSFREDLLRDPDMKYVLYQNKIMLSVPRNLQWAYTDVFRPMFNSTQTPQDCYAYFKARTYEKMERYERKYYPNFITREIIAQAICEDDADWDGILREVITEHLNRAERLIKKYPEDKEVVDTYEETKWQYRVLFEGARNEYLEHLERKRQKNIREFSKITKLNIPETLF